MTNQEGVGDLQNAVARVEVLAAEALPVDGVHVLLLFIEIHGTEKHKGNRTAESWTGVAGCSGE